MAARIKVAPWAPDVEPLVRELLEHGIPADATDIYEGRNRVVRLCREGREINVKEFKIPNILNRVAYTTVRHSKAARAYEYALRLRNLGFNTPEPLAYAELRTGPLLGLSYFVSQQLDGFRDMREIDEADDTAMLADSLGALMARMHDSGIWMKDFSPGNVLRRRTGRKGLYEFFLVDINRMEFGVTSHSRLMDNFGRITGDPAFLRILVRAYARHSGRPLGEVEAEALAARSRYHKI